MFDPVKAIMREYHSTTRKFGAFASTHEGLTVVRGEYLELEKEVFWGTDQIAMANEAIQLGAMALRFLVDCCEGSAPKQHSKESGKTSVGQTKC
jgi:hypothetical protein